MTYEQAVEKAQNTNSEVYAISFDRAEFAKSMVGKTATNSKTGVSMTIVEWIGQNYIMLRNNDYSVVPVTYFLQVSKALVIS